MDRKWDRRGLFEILDYLISQHVSIKKKKIKTKEVIRRIKISIGSVRHNLPFFID